MRTTAQKIVAAVIAMAACLITAQPAHASQGRAMVTFGDSFTANGGAPGERDHCPALACMGGLRSGEAGDQSDGGRGNFACCVSHILKSLGIGKIGAL